MGDVTVGAGCYIDYGVVIASSGPPVVLGEGVSVLANAVIRSVGGHGRPAFPVRIGDGASSPREWLPYQGVMAEISWKTPAGARRTVDAVGAG